MIRKPISASISAFAFAVLLSSAALTNSFITYAETETNTTVMENCGAYLFTWRPVDCGNGRYFAILAGGNTIAEQDVILNRGYDYAYTFSPTLPRPWGEVPSLVNVDGRWGIPENSSLIPEGSQAVTRMVLVTNNGNSSTKERYVDIVSLPSGVNVSDLPAEVRKYLINVDGTDAGAYDGTLTSGWYQEDGQCVTDKLMEHIYPTAGLLWTISSISWTQKALCWLTPSPLMDIMLMTEGSEKIISPVGHKQKTAGDTL